MTFYKPAGITQKQHALMAHILTAVKQMIAKAWLYKTIRIAEVKARMHWVPS